MKQNKILIFALVMVFLSLNFLSAVVVDADYITIYSGEQENLKIEIENNENFDIEDISFNLVLDTIPFTAVGSSERNIEDIDEDDDDSVSFKIKASTEIIPGDYNIPYLIKYINAEEDNQSFEKTGSFGIRVSAKTDIDFSVETKEAIVGNQDKLSLKIINKGLGEVKFVSIEIFPQGYELISSKSVYLGTIDSDDSDFASFDVIYKTENPSLSAKISYKDFDNNDQIKTINIPFNVYSKEKALELGIIKKSNVGTYSLAIGTLVLVWIIYRTIKKRKKNNQR